GLAGVAGQAALLLERVEAGHPPGEQLVDVRLVAGVPDDRVARRVEDPVDGDGEFHHTEVGPEVAAEPRARLHEQVANLTRQPRQLSGSEPFDVVRSLDR